MEPKPKSKLSHPYEEFEETELWKALNKGILDLVKNKDLKEITRREYVVGYLCKALTLRKDKLFSKRVAASRSQTNHRNS
jgi:hypothetical protein